MWAIEPSQRPFAVGRKLAVVRESPDLSQSQLTLTNQVASADSPLYNCYMDIVVDTNIFLAVALNEPEKGRIVELTTDATALSPEILPYEIGNALSAMVKRRKLSHTEALEVEKAVSRIPVRLMSVDVLASLRIALEHDIYAYDAYFLQCARASSCPLLTLDRRMKHVADQLSLKVLE